MARKAHPKSYHIHFSMYLLLKMFWQPSCTRVPCEQCVQCSPSAAVPTGVRLVTTSATQHRRKHHLPLISEGTSAKRESAPSSADPSLGSVQTPGAYGEGMEHPYSGLPSQYEVVVTHYVAGDVDNVFDGLQQKSLASSTPPKTAYTVVPVKVCGHAFNHWHFSSPALSSRSAPWCVVRT